MTPETQAQRNQFFYVPTMLNGLLILTHKGVHAAGLGLLVQFELRQPSYQV